MATPDDKTFVSVSAQKYLFFPFFARTGVLHLVMCHLNIFLEPFPSEKQGGETKVGGPINYTASFLLTTDNESAPHPFSRDPTTLKSEQKFQQTVFFQS